MVTMKNVELRKCPKCGHSFYDIDDKKDMKWVKNGHKYKMGNKMVEAVDPVPIRGTCCYCHTVVEFEQLKRERVEFT
jgi:Zn ribbon nucleic-acid-binding protein